MQPLPPEVLPSVPQFSFFIFNIAIPNLIAVAVVIVVFLVAVWSRLPKIF